MPFNPERFVNPKLLQVKPYQPGKPIAECQRELGLTDFIKMASNENPFGTSPHVTNHLAKEFSQLALYPDSNAYELKMALSKHLHVAVEQLILGNGSEDVLRMIIQTFVWGNQHILISEYAFVAYKILAQGLGVDIKEIPANQYSVDLDAILAATTSETRMIILANPNNPTGTYVNQLDFKRFLDALSSDIFVVCDEAYYEYIIEQDYPQTISMLNDYPNLIITRTFSKAYGLAGLRVGYGIARPSVVELINRNRQPFNINHIGQIAAKLALEDQDFVRKSILQNEQGKQQLSNGLERLGLSYLPSHGNFIAVEIILPGKDVFQELLQHGIIVRPLAPYKLENFFRITIGTSDDNTACLKVLEKVLQKEKVV
ncbi:MAG: histidinol-phosphate transaminase [Gammaproteobacteria bacterium]|jgi:histidinol-phosphate aminotransferase|nr:histidinol-phosphate transaminase [Gammaproteobacteria bacterium]